MVYYGISASASIDDFQIGESTCRFCVSKLTYCLVKFHALADVFLRKPTKANACNIVELHERAHKIPGMQGSLNMSKSNGRIVELP
jgi:hypothetical protein